MFVGWILSLQNHQLLDIDADRSNIRRLLGDIQISIDELQAQAFKYKTYQKNFKVSVSLCPADGAFSVFILCTFCFEFVCLIIMSYKKMNLYLCMQVEVTKYNALEGLTAEVKLKQLLWDSLEEWENLENSWLQVILRGSFFTFEIFDFFLSLKST